MDKHISYNEQNIDSYYIQDDDCPFGGDISNDCEECVYSIDYMYDPQSSECVRRPDR